MSSLEGVPSRYGRPARLRIDRSRALPVDLRGSRATIWCPQPSHLEEGAMKYVCLVYLVEKDMTALSKREADARPADSRPYEAALRRTGLHIVAQTLQPVETATTIRV